jgi:hypothetical protein
MEIWAQNRLSRYYRERRHTALLIAIVVSFAIRPLIGDSGDAPIVFSLAMLALMLVALYTVHVDLLSESQGIYRGRRSVGLVSFSFVTWSQLRSLLIQRKVTSETISLSISVYLLLGMSGAGRSEQE